MVEPADDAFKVTDAIAIAVGKAARIDLVDRSALPPGLSVLGHDVGDSLFIRQWAISLISCEIGQGKASQKNCLSG